MMTMDSLERLRDWGSSLEQALGIPIVVDQNGMLALTTKGGNVFSIAPAPTPVGLLFTGILGMADDTMPASTLRALLAVNMAPSLSGMANVGVAPATHEILLKLTWMPNEANWTESAFAGVLIAFAEHVDALAAAIRDGELQSILALASIPDPSLASSATDLTDLA
ncbi:Type III secretion system chaperone [Bordetella tumbae]|uniref:CesT family type III secretion system chaperone n=1 Tax=Bordetella tumbae TaxID=1649139 RepID=UPI0039F0C1CC